VAPSKLFQVKDLKEVRLIEISLEMDIEFLMFATCTIVDIISSAVLRGISHEGRLIGRDARNLEQEVKRDTRVRQVRAVSTM